MDWLNKNTIQIIFSLSILYVFFQGILILVKNQAGILIITFPLALGFLGLVGFVLSFLATNVKIFFTLILITGYSLSLFLTKLWKHNKKFFVAYYIISLLLLVLIILLIFLSGDKNIQSVIEEISVDSADKVSIVENTLLWQGRNFNNTLHKPLFENILNRFPYKPMLCKNSGLGRRLDSRWNAIVKCGACGEYTNFFMEFTERLNIENRKINSYGRDHTWAEVNINGNWIPVETTAVDGYNHSSFYDCNNTVTFSYITYMDYDGKEREITEKYLCPQHMGRLVIRTAEDADVIINTPHREISKKADSDGVLEIDLGIGNYTVEVKYWLFQNKKPVKVKSNETSEMNICPSKINYDFLTIILLPIVIMIEVFIIVRYQKRKHRRKE